PPGVYDTGTLVLRTDSVFPVICIGKASTWPAEVGNLKLPEGFNHILANTIDMGNFGVRFSNVEPAVDTSSKVFGKVTINMFVYGMLAILRLESHCVLGITGHHG